MPLATVLRLLRPIGGRRRRRWRSPTGALLFASNAREYAATPLFQLKMAIVAFGILHALYHVRGFADRGGLGQRVAGLVSGFVWIAALLCGRLLAFV